jgi:hypothetical protein
VRARVGGGVAEEEGGEGGCQGGWQSKSVTEGGLQAREGELLLLGCEGGGPLARRGGGAAASAAASEPGAHQPQRERGTVNVAWQHGARGH